MESDSSNFKEQLDLLEGEIKMSEELLANRTAEDRQDRR